MGNYQKKMNDLCMEDFRAKFSNFIYRVLPKFRKLHNNIIAQLKLQTKIGTLITWIKKNDGPN